VCTIDDPKGEPRKVTSAMSYGRIITEMTFKINTKTRDIVRPSVDAVNHLVTRDVPRHPGVQAIVDKWVAKAAGPGNRVVGSVKEDIRRAVTSGREDRGKESSLSNLIADAQKASTGSQIAFMNPGGVRADLLVNNSPAGEAAGQITYREAFNVQPFSNILMTIPMTGAQIIDVLEEQCQPQSASRPFLHLGVSTGFTYDLSKTINAANKCTGVVVSNVRLNGVPLDSNATYIVTVNNFLADGGDNFVTFRQVNPALRIGGGIDLDELVNYLGSEGPIAPPGINRVNELP
jgi:5'-nucleotidase